MPSVVTNGDEHNLRCPACARIMHDHARGQVKAVLKERPDLVVLLKRRCPFCQVALLLTCRTAVAFTAEVTTPTGDISP